MNLDIDELAALTALLQDGAMSSNSPGNASVLEKVQQVSVKISLTSEERACVQQLLVDIGPHCEVHPATSRLARKLRRADMDVQLRRLLLQNYQAAPHLTRQQFIEEWADKLGIPEARVLEVMGL